MQRSAQNFVRSFSVVLVAFALHRVLSFEFIAPQGFQYSLVDKFLFYFVGLLSDLWVAALFAWMVLIVRLCFAAFGAKAAAVGDFFSVGLVLVVCVSAALHQPYVEFFRFQFMPVHLPYLLDWHFISANGSVAWSLSSLIIIVVAMLIFGFLSLVDRRSLKVRYRRPASVLLCLSGLALAAHTFNIWARVQWFVPELLRANYFESFYVAAVSANTPPPLSDADVVALAVRSGQEYSSEESLEALRARLALRPQPPAIEHQAGAQNIRKLVGDAARHGEKPIVLLVLMESMRPSESGLYGGVLPSLTPELDQLARQGFWYRNAYSTGNVTRGGQEAVWCGYFSNQTNSAMRNRPDLDLACLPDEIARRQQPIRVGWYHGGRGEFDGQRFFWAKRNVGRIIADNNFPPDVPRTSWGVSDAVLFDRVIEELKDFKAYAEQPLFLGMVLTISNHIPWQLPADLPEHLRPMVFSLTDPSYHTVVYADWALGRFVRDLKAQGLWDKALILFVSDHGHAVRPYQAPTVPNAMQLYEDTTHIHLVISGGIGETVAHRPGQFGSDEQTRYVSQADVAPFLAFVLGLDAMRFFSDGLMLNKATPRLVVADTGHGIFLPEKKMLFSYRDFAKHGSALADDDQLRRYVNFIHAINTAGRLHAK